MTLAFLIELAAKSSLISAATLLALLTLARRSAAERSLVAHIGLLATVVVPTCSMLMPQLHLMPMLEWLSDRRAPLWLYLPPVLILVGITAIAIFRLFALRHRAAVLVEPAWLGALAHAQRRMGFKSGAALLVSGDVTSPVSWGLFRPTIVLDPRAIAVPDKAEAIIAHELAHVARLDWAKLLMARVATALCWFNPLVWILARQCHELREEAADDAVLHHDVDGAGYASVLVGSARHECRGFLLAANGVAPSKGSLRRRVTRVLDGGLRRAPAGLGFASVGVIVALMLGAPLAAITLEAKAVQPVAKTRATAAVVTSAEIVPAITPTPPSVADARVSVAPVAPMTPAAAPTRVVPLARIEDHPYVGRFSSGELVAMAAQGVTPQWLNEMAALGYRDLPANEIVAMAVHGVTPDYVRQMAAAGYKRPNVDQLVAMRIQGVTPAYARAVAGQGEPPSLDWLIALRIAKGDVVSRVNAIKEAKRKELRAEMRAANPPPVPPRPPSRLSDPDDDNAVEHDSE